MKRLLAGLLTLVTLGVGACAREGVYGYCGAGDTCRYDLPEKMLVRTYSGFIEPGAAEFAAIKAPSGAVSLVEAGADEPRADAAMVTPVSVGAASAPVATVVAISN